MGYSVKEEDFGKETVYVLADRERDQEVRVLPGVGNNCVGFRDRGVELIYSPPDVETLQGRPSGYGVPILFPWPNRIEGGRFRFDGKEYQLDVPGPTPHASHGFVLNRPWEVMGRGGAEAEGAWLTCRFQAEDFSEVMRQFPFPFEVVVTYRLLGGALELEIEATAGVEMPVGLGIHPYFPLPLGEDGHRESCVVQIPAETYWPLREDCIPTGEVLPVSGKYDLWEMTPLDGLTYDNVWSGVQQVDGWSRCEYVDPGVGVRVLVEADAVFREWVLYAPGDRPVISLEPYTCVTNAFNLEVQGADAGLIRLGAGERLRGIMRIAVERKL